MAAEPPKTIRGTGRVYPKRNEKILFSDEKIGLDKAFVNCNNITMIKVVWRLGGILPPNNPVTPDAVHTSVRLFYLRLGVV